MKTDTTQIPITVLTRTRLREFGKKGQTYDELVNELMDFYKRKYQRFLSSSKARGERYNKIVTYNISLDEFVGAIDKTNGVCKTCNKDVGLSRLTVDHKLPLSYAPEGFVYTLNDIQFMCGNCNNKKRVSIPEEYSNLDLVKWKGVSAIIDFDDETDKKLRIWMVENNYTSKAEAIVEILRRYLEVERK